MIDDTAKIDGRKVKPLPCPFCGSKRAFAFKQGEDAYWVYCGACSAEGSLADAKAKAVAVWNRVASRAALDTPPTG